MSERETQARPERGGGARGRWPTSGRPSRDTVGRGFSCTHPPTPNNQLIVFLFIDFKVAQSCTD